MHSRAGLFAVSRHCVSALFAVDSPLRCRFCTAKYSGKIKLTSELTTSKKNMLKFDIWPEIDEKRADRYAPFAVCEYSAWENALFLASFFIVNELFFTFFMLFQGPF